MTAHITHPIKFTYQGAANPEKPAYIFLVGVIHTNPGHLAYFCIEQDNDGHRIFKTINHETAEKTIYSGDYEPDEPSS